MCIEWNVPEYEKRAAELHRTGATGPLDPLGLAIGARRSMKTISIVLGHLTWDDPKEMKREAAKAISQLREASAICKDAHTMIVSGKMQLRVPGSGFSFFYKSIMRVDL